MGGAHSQVTGLVMRRRAVMADKIVQAFHDRAGQIARIFIQLEGADDPAAALLIEGHDRHHIGEVTVQAAIWIRVMGDESHQQFLFGKRRCREIPLVTIFQQGALARQKFLPFQPVAPSGASRVSSTQRK